MATTNSQDSLAIIKKHIAAIPDFPKKGILFRDIFPMTRNPVALAACIDLLTAHIENNLGKVDAIVGLDARGFIFGPLVAQRLQTGFIPIRKAGKLPGETFQVAYELEYGTATFECQKDAIKPGEKIVVIDDLLATGGTMAAAHKLVSQMKGDVLESIVVIELADLNGRSKVPGKLFSLVTY